MAKTLAENMRHLLTKPVTVRSVDGSDIAGMVSGVSDDHLEITNIVGPYWRVVVPFTGIAYVRVQP